MDGVLTRSELMEAFDSINRNYQLRIWFRFLIFFLWKTPKKKGWLYDDALTAMDLDSNKKIDSKEFAISTHLVVREVQSSHHTKTEGSSFQLINQTVSSKLIVPISDWSGWRSGRTIRRWTSDYFFWFAPIRIQIRFAPIRI